MERLDPTQRFGDRVAEYARYRPSYPAEMVELLIEEYDLHRGALVADLGSGTGILSRLFLDRGFEVRGVEPNQAMAQAAEVLLAEYDGFESLPGRAEETGLPPASVALVVAGQAFHWFDVERCRLEFRRISRPGAGVALLWNLRRPGVAFMDAYEEFLRQWGRGYDCIAGRYARPESLRRLFGAGGYRHCSFANSQRLDFAGFHGRILSASYMPRRDDADHDAMRRALRRLFDRYQEDGCVELQYRTELYHGGLTPG